MLPIVGSLPADDPRVLATIDAIAGRLTDNNGLVYRYRAAGGADGDGLASEEGTFLVCTFWLAQALALAGRTDGRTEQARDVFGRATRYVRTSARSPRRSTPAPASCSATSRRRPATSG